MTPWGLRSGYSGPVVLQGRLFSKVRADYNVEITALYRARTDHEQIPSWATRAISIGAPNETFGRMAQLQWIVRASWFVLRDRRGFNVVHLHGMYLTNLIPSLFVSRHTTVVGLPVVENGDLAPSSNSVGRMIKGVIQRRVLRKSSKVFALSSGIESELRLRGVEDKDVIRIGNPVDEVFFTGAPAHLSDSVRLGFLGKLGYTKQPHIILDSIYRLRSNGFDATGAFAGPFESTDYEDFFRTKIKTLGLSSAVTLFGYLESPIDFLQREIDLFVLPSKSEGMPGAMAEAMAVGIPSLVTDVGAMGEIVAASSGGIVVAGNSQSICDAVESFLIDPSEWTRASLCASSYALANFSSKNVATKYAEALALPRRSHKPSTRK